MSDEIFLEGKTYVSAKRAAELSGYARDYIGELARGGLIEAQRVGGLWYVSMDSLKGYQQNAVSYTPAPPLHRGTNLDTVISFDGKDYVSASRGAKLTSYNQDYIGQLARAGKILSRQIGNRWYVERRGLLAHKAQKDALLAAVQRESVGLVRPDEPQKLTETGETSASLHETYTGAGPYLTYVTEKDMDLMPVLGAQDAGEQEEREVLGSGKTLQEKYNIPIRVLHALPKAPGIQGKKAAFHRPVRTHGKTMIRAAEATVALTFIIVLSYGLVSLKNGSVYTFNTSGALKGISSETFTASAAEALGWLGDFLENILSPEIRYIRTP